MTIAKRRFRLLIVFFTVLCTWGAVINGLPLKRAENGATAEDVKQKNDTDSTEKKWTTKKHCGCFPKGTPETRRTIIAPTKESDKPVAKEASCRCLCAKCESKTPKAKKEQKVDNEACGCGKPEKRECHHWECHREHPDGTKEDCCGCDECEHHECHGKNGDCCCHHEEHHESNKCEKKDDCCGDCDHCCGDCDHCCGDCHHCCGDCDHCCGDCGHCCCHHGCCGDCDHCCHCCCGDCNHDCDHDCDHGCCGHCCHHCCCCDRRSTCISGGHTKQVKLSIAASATKPEKEHKRCCGHCGGNSKQVKLSIAASAALHGKRNKSCCAGCTRSPAGDNSKQIKLMVAASAVNQEKSNKRCCCSCPRWHCGCFADGWRRRHRFCHHRYCHHGSPCYNYSFHTPWYHPGRQGNGCWGYGFSSNGCGGYSGYGGYGGCGGNGGTSGWGGNGFGGYGQGNGGCGCGFNNNVGWGYGGYGQQYNGYNHHNALSLQQPCDIIDLAKAGHHGGGEVNGYSPLPSVANQAGSWTCAGGNGNNVIGVNGGGYGNTFGIGGGVTVDTGCGGMHPVSGNYNGCGCGGYGLGKKSELPNDVNSTDHTTKDYDSH